MKDLGILASRQAVPDLAPVDEALVEWWFLQGWVEGPEVPRTHAMVSFFLIRGPQGDDRRGAMQIQHVLTPETGESWIDSRINPDAVSVHGDIAAKIAAGFPRAMRRLALWRHHRDMETWVQRSGMVVDETGPQVRAAPLTLAWNGFRLSQDDACFAMDMPVSRSRTLALTLRPESCWLDERSSSLHPGLDDIFSYVCCPRLAASGQMGGAEVTGQFWFDRQWGVWDGWLLEEFGESARMLGWHWFGLNLDDGRDLLLFHQLDPATQAPRFSSGIVFEDGQPRSAGRMHHVPRRVWVSPHTNATYPVEWDIALPDLDLAARVSPVVDDQEIPIYGTTAIWEGAAEVRGTSRGQPLGGIGRMELVGYGTPLTLSDHFGRSLRRFGQNLSGSLRLGRR